MNSTLMVEGHEVSYKTWRLVNKYLGKSILTWQDIKTTRKELTKYIKAIGKYVSGEDIQKLRSREQDIALKHNKWRRCLSLKEHYDIMVKHKPICANGGSAKIDWASLSLIREMKFYEFVDGFREVVW